MNEGNQMNRTERFQPTEPTRLPPDTRYEPADEEPQDEEEMAGWELARACRLRQPVPGGYDD